MDVYVSNIIFLAVPPVSMFLVEIPQSRHGW